MAVNTLRLPRQARALSGAVRLRSREGPRPAASRLIDGGRCFLDPLTPTAGRGLPDRGRGGLPSTALPRAELHREWIADGQVPVDDLAVLQILGIQRRALSFERRSGNERIVDVKLVLRGDPEARLVGLNRERHG